MEELSKELTKRMAKDLRTAKTYHVGKKSFIKLAKDYCEYERHCIYSVSRNLLA